MMRDRCDFTNIWDELLFCHHVFKLIHIKLSKSPVLGDVALLETTELELGPPWRTSITGTLFCSLVQMDLMNWAMWTLASVPWGFPKALCNPVWSTDWGRHASHARPLERAVSKAP